MSIAPHTEQQSTPAHRRDDERGYALLALLAAMAILVILLSAAAPVLKHQAQREKELEAIRRGEQVAQAIRDYISLSPNRNTLPTSMEELLEGARPSGRTRRTQVLRRSSMRDPLSSDGEWRLIIQTDPALRSFCNDVRRYAETTMLTVAPTTPEVLRTTQSLACLSLPIDIGEPDEPDEPLPDSVQTSGPFVGVASKSQSPSIINYYGIDKHRRWIFTPLFR